MVEVEGVDGVEELALPHLPHLRVHVAVQQPTYKYEEDVSTLGRQYLKDDD